MFKGVIIVILFIAISASYVSAQENTISYTPNGTAIATSITPSLEVPEGFERTGSFPQDIRISAVRELVSTDDGYLITLNDRSVYSTNNSDFFSVWKETSGPTGRVLYKLRDGKILSLGIDSLYVLGSNRETWQFFSSYPSFGDGAPQTIFESSNGDIFIGQQGGRSLVSLYVSKDKGISWIPINYPGGDTYILDLAEYNGILYLTGYLNGLLRSTDGLIWQRISTIPDVITTVIVTNDGKILAGEYYGHIKISQDGGITWTSINIGSDVPNQFFKTSDGSIYLGTSTGLWKSDPSGLNWEKLFSVGSGEILAIAEGIDGRLYVGAPGIDDIHPILRSTFSVTTTTTTTTINATSTTTTIPDFLTRDEILALLAERDVRISSLESQLAILESRTSLLESAMEAINSRLSEIGEDLLQLFAYMTESLSRLSSVEERISLAEISILALNSQITNLQNQVSNINTNLFGLPKGLREQMVCDAMKATNQTSASGFGLTCSLNDKGSCSCS